MLSWVESEKQALPAKVMNTILGATAGFGWLDFVLGITKLLSMSVR